MKRNAIIIILLAALAGCAPVGSFMDGPGDIPGSVNGVTDVGNPNDEIESPTQPKGIYVNAEFDVAIEYPVDWSLDVDGTYEARFSSDDDESAIATFMWLEQGDSFDAFLEEVAGDTSGFIMMEKTGFQTFLCDVAEPGEEGMNVSRCYLHNIGDKGDFAMVFSAQLYGSMDGFHIIPMDRYVRPEEFKVTDYKIPFLEFNPSAVSKGPSFQVELAQ